MGFRDAQIDTIRKRIWIPPEVMQAVDNVNTTGRGWLDTTVVPAEVSTFGYGSLSVVASDLIGGFIPCPYDLDPKFDIGFRIAYTMDHDGTGAATTSWIMLQNAVKEGAVFSTPTSALDTVIALLDSYADGAAVDWYLAWTARGVRKASNIGLTRSDIENGSMLTFSIELDAVANATSTHYLGLEIDYVPQICEGVGREIDAPLAS